MTARGMSASATSFSNEDQQIKKIHVTRIPGKLHNYDAFRSHFARFGKILQCFLHPSKQFGHVTFGSHEMAYRAIQNAAQVEPNVTMIIRWWENKGPPPQQPTQTASMGGVRRKSYSVPEKPSPSNEPTRGPQMRASPETANQKEPIASSAQFWCTLPRLPAAEGTRCLLVQNADPNVYMQNVIMHFENKKRSNGGPVTSVTKMVDGILVVFKNEQDCLSSLDRKNQQLGGRELRFFLKIVPTYFENKIVISGVGESTSLETIELFLESCSAYETSPVSCEKQDLPGVYVITYGSDFDASEITTLLKEICSKELECHKIKGSLLLRTDCLKVTNVPAKVSDDNIKLIFESKKRANGGPVTRIDRLTDNVALVYFAAYTDAERVYASVTVGREIAFVPSRPVIIELYFHSLHQKCGHVSNEPSQSSKSGTSAGQNTERKQLVKQFNHQIKDKEQIIEFIRESNKHRNLFKFHLKHLATVYITGKKMGPMSVAFTPIKEAMDKTQAEFNEDCTKLLRSFLLKYDAQRQMFKTTKLQNSRSLNLYPEVHEEYKEDDVAVCWEGNRADIVGTKKAVAAMLERIRDCVNFVTSQLHMSGDSYRVVIACDIIDDLEAQFPLVRIQPDDQFKCLTLSGQKSKVDEVQDISYITDQNTVKVIFHGSDLFVTFLRESLEAENDYVISNFQKRFKESGIKATLYLEQHEPCIIAKTQNDIKSARVIVGEAVVTETVSVAWTPGTWRKFQESEANVKGAKYYGKANRSTQVVGFPKDVLLLKQKLAEFLEENTIKKFLLKTSFGNSRYLLEGPCGYLERCKAMSVTCKVFSEEDGGVLLQGTSKNVMEVIPEMQKVLREIREFKHAYCQPGIKDYFCGGDGKLFLKMVEQNCKCIILPSWEYAKAKGKDMSESDGVDECMKGMSGMQMNTSMDNRKVVYLKCQVTLMEGDIHDLSREADVAVNTTNPSSLFSMKGSSISRSFAQATGSPLSPSSFEDLPNPPYKLGDVYKSHGGSMECKLFHAIITYYDARTAESLIRIVVSKCMRKAENDGYSSLVFPAIGTGGFGHPPKSVALWMREEISRFSGSCLKNIIIVLYPKNQEVITAFTSEFKSPYSFLMRYSPANNGKKTTSALIGPLVVSVYQGTIEHDQSDVIAVAANPAFRMFYGPLRNAGVQNELLSASGDNFKVTSGGKLCCKKIFHFRRVDEVGEYRKVILKVLQNAEALRMSSVCIEETEDDDICSTKAACAIRLAIEDFLNENPRPNALNGVNCLAHGYIKEVFEQIILDTNRTAYLSASEDESEWTYPAPKFSPATFNIFSRSTEDVSKAIRQVSDQLQKVVCLELLVEDTLTRISDWERWKIREIGVENDVELTECLDRGSNLVALKGINTAVVKAQAEIKNVLKEFVAAESIASLVTWQKLSASMTWEDYHLNANFILEKAYKKFKECPHSSTVDVPHFVKGKVTLQKVDLSTVDAGHIRAGAGDVRRKVRETAKNPDDLPKYWEDMEGKLVKKVGVTNTSSEYRAVFTLFKQTGAPCTKIMIQRIQNVSLYKQYLAKKKEVQQKLRLSKLPVERRLFHGTTDGDKIILHGFDRSYAGKNATVHGKGVYFATTSSYAHNFTQVLRNGYRQMLVADVITGIFCKSDPTYSAAPTKPGSSQVYDSVVNDISVPSIFVIFKDASAYPAYLITYA